MSAAEEHRRTGRHEREQSDRYHGGRKASPVDPEEQGGSHHDEHRLQERDRVPAERLSCEHRPDRRRRRDHPPGHADPPRLDEHRRGRERGDEDEEHQFLCRSRAVPLACSPPAVEVRTSTGGTVSARLAPSPWPRRTRLPFPADGEPSSCVRHALLIDDRADGEGEVLTAPVGRVTHGTSTVSPARIGVVSPWDHHAALEIAALHRLAQGSSFSNSRISTPSSGSQPPVEVRWRAAPPARTTPRRGVNPDPKVAPRPKIRRNGKTNRKNTPVRSFVRRRTLTAAIQRAFGPPSYPHQLPRADPRE